MNTHHLALESTPLLPVQNSSEDPDATPILPVVQSLDVTDLSHIRWEDLSPRPIPASLELDQCKRLAFALIVLLQLRKQKIAWNRNSSDIYEQWTEEEARFRDVEIVEEKVSELWENFLAQYHGPQEIYDVLWTPFPLKQGKLATIKVVDFLASRDAPQKFVAHPILSMTMSRAWRFGRPESNAPEAWLSTILCTNATPSKTHFLELLFDLASTFILLTYVMRPPNWPHSDDKWRNPPTIYPYTIREAYLVVYAFSVLVSAQGTNVIISTLILLAFVLALPSLPLPSSISFTILLWMILLRLFMYHITTIPPSPLLLVSHQYSFPLATFLAKGLARIIRPLLLLYLPIMLVACLALSVSLSGPLTGPLTYLRNFHAFIFPPGPDPPTIGAAPMDTRVVFFLLSVVVILLVLSSAYIIGTSTPVAYVRPVIWSSTSTWDSYSPEIGHDARVASYRAAVSYSGDYPFPPPFNLIELLLVTIPFELIRAFGRSQLKRATIASIIWNITVRPFVVIITPLCALFA